MSEHDAKELQPTNYSQLIYFSSLYFISLGVLYLWGYWGQFNINILEYLSITDILKQTAYPLVLSSVFLFIGFLLGVFAGEQASRITKRNVVFFKLLDKIKSQTVYKYYLVVFLLFNIILISVVSG